MSRFFKGYNGTEMSRFRPVEPPPQETLYYNAVSGQRLSGSLSESENDYEDTLPREPMGRGLKPGSFGDIYDDTLPRESTLPNFNTFSYDCVDSPTTQRRAAAMYPAEREPDITVADVYHEYEETEPGMRSVWVQRSEHGFMEAQEKQAGTRTELSKQTVGMNDDNPSSKSGRRRCQGPCCYRVMFLWMVILLGLLIGAVVYISLMQTELNACRLELESFNISSTSSRLS